MTGLIPLRRPRRLQPGDRVAVVAPSGPVDPGRLERGCAVLRGLGLRVVVGEHVLGRPGRHAYLAADDALRAGDLQRAWLDPGIAAVCCARGGYGATRLLDHLCWEAMADTEPKILLGSSDATALHQAFAAHLGVVTLYGPMIATALLGDRQPDPVSLAHLRTMLFEPGQAGAITTTRSRPLAGGRAVGITTGGTLSLIAAALGTPECRTAEGGIVLLEDVGEAPYRIDRMLTQLLRAGWLSGVAGIVTGGWLNCGSPDAVDRVLTERLAPLGVPVLAGVPFGHGVPQLTIPLGVRAELDADAGTLTFGPPLSPPPV